MNTRSLIVSVRLLMSRTVTEPHVLDESETRFVLCVLTSTGIIRTVKATDLSSIGYSLSAWPRSRRRRVCDQENCNLKYMNCSSDEDLSDDCCPDGLCYKSDMRTLPNGNRIPGGNIGGSGFGGWFTREVWPLMLWTTVSVLALLGLVMLFKFREYLRRYSPVRSDSSEGSERTRRRSGRSLSRNAMANGVGHSFETTVAAMCRPDDEATLAQAEAEANLISAVAQPMPGMPVLAGPVFLPAMPHALLFGSNPTVTAAVMALGGPAAAAAAVAAAAAAGEVPDEQWPRRERKSASSHKGPTGFRSLKKRLRRMLNGMFSRRSRRRLDRTASPSVADISDVEAPNLMIDTATEQLPSAEETAAALDLWYRENTRMLNEMYGDLAQLYGGYHDQAMAVHPSMSANLQSFAEARAAPMGPMELKRSQSQEVLRKMEERHQTSVMRRQAVEYWTARLKELLSKAEEPEDDTESTTQTQLTKAEPLLEDSDENDESLPKEASEKLAPTISMPETRKSQKASSVGKVAGDKALQASVPRAKHAADREDAETMKTRTSVMSIVGTTAAFPVAAKQPTQTIAAAKQPPQTDRHRSNQQQQQQQQQQLQPPQYLRRRQQEQRQLNQEQQQKTEEQQQQEPPRQQPLPLEEQLQLQQDQQPQPQQEQSQQQLRLLMQEQTQQSQLLPQQQEQQMLMQRQPQRLRLSQPLQSQPLRLTGRPSAYGRPRAEVRSRTRLPVATSMGVVKSPSRKGRSPSGQLS